MEILARSVGRRKEAVAQVQIVKGTGQFLINDKFVDDYLQNNSCSIISVKAPLEVLKTFNQVSTDNEETIQTNLCFDTFVKVKGGGIIGQAEAIKLALARAICDINSVPLQSLLITDSDVKKTNLEEKTSNILTEVRKQFKTKGYLTQDSRIKERRKYGLKKARKATQYNKR